MPTTIYSKMQQRYDAAASWTSTNPVLLAGEIGIESDTNKFKIGNGTSAWNALSYATSVSINDLSDVDTATSPPTGGEVLTWNAALSVWKPGSGGGTGGATQLTLTNQATSLAAGSTADFTIQAGSAFTLLSITSSHPAWIRIYSSAAARTADTRVIPGHPYPDSGSGLNAEIATSVNAQTVTFAPVPFCQGSALGLAFVRVVNRGIYTQTIDTTYSALSFSGT